MKRATNFLLCELLGAVVSACVIFLYRADTLASVGISPNSVPLFTLLTDVMELHRWAAYGAALGVLAALLATLAGLVRWLIRARELPAAPQDADLEVDLDQLIRSHRARRAEQYFARRRARITGPEPPT
jgi:hypothetical protein